jgi:hypothetical protein
VGEYFHSVDIGKSYVLVLHDVCEMIEFYKKYSSDRSPYSGLGEFGNWIDWKKVAKDYCGIEIPRYLWSCRMSHSWYYGWDVASGCIWDLKHVSMQLIEEEVLCPA